VKFRAFAAIIVMAAFTGCEDDDDTFAGCDVVQESVDFGTVTTLPDDVLTRSFIQVVTINNTGTRTLELESHFQGPAGTPQFHINHSEDAEISIEPGEMTSIEIAATLNQNTVPGTYTGTLSLGSPCETVSLLITVQPE
jgi:hypothetical protein